MFCRYVFLYVLICTFLCVAETSAGTLEDIRAKTGREPAEHSKRETAYCPLLTPAKLVAYLNKYHRNTIRMQVLFSKITTHELNTWIGPRGSRHKWSSKRYIAFMIKDPLGRVRSSNIYLFLDKDNSDVARLLGLTLGTKITIKGFVKDIERKKAWIEVNKIDLGWEE